MLIPTKKQFFVLPLLLVVAACSTLLHAAAELSVSHAVSAEGYVTFRWQLPDESVPGIRLQISRDADFARILQDAGMRGQQQAQLSGFDDGDYYGRMVNNRGERLSNVVEFKVRHHDLRVAGLLFAVGFLLFAILTVIMIRFTTGKQLAGS